jgi:Protein of unknown function (DUF1579)
MKINIEPKTMLPLLLAAAFTQAFFANTAIAEDKPSGGQPTEAQMAAMMMEAGKPGENHKLLAGFVGTWKYHTKYWMNPDPKAPPMESDGKAVVKSIMGGRYIESNHTGKMQMQGPEGHKMDMEFKGMEIDGFDNSLKKFVGSWIDNMGTGIMHSEGTYDPATSTLTYHSEYSPMPGTITKVRQTIKIVDKDHHAFEFFEDHDGKEMKTMEITYIRKS